MEQLEKPATRLFVIGAILVWAYIKHSMVIPMLHGADASTFKADGATPNTATSPAVTVNGTTYPAGVN